MAKIKLLPSNKIYRQLIFVIAINCAIVFTLWLLDKNFPLNLKRYQSTSTLIYGQNNKLLHSFLSKDEKYRLQLTVGEINPLYLETLIKREDRYYYYHRGVNPLSILRAMGQHILAGHVVSGASTITMQTARLLEPRKRDIKAKIIECFRALQLEYHFSKKEILNIYMTLAPMGGNIEGIKAATLAYFNKSPHMLNIPEIALLIAISQSPSGLRPDRYPDKAIKARNHILSFMQLKNLITSSEYNIHLQAPLSLSLLKFPHEIPHLAWRLHQEFPKQSSISTSIHSSIQTNIEQILKQYRSLLPPRANCAILVLDHVNNKPLAYIGSVDFLDQQHHGFVDYIRAYRSPGSTLKPFIYGLAFDSAMIHADDLVSDVRRRFGAYYPNNFNKESYGMISVREALALSLNIPAVAILNDIGVTRFISLLKEIGVEPKFPPLERPGLSTALGGLGLTLEQLVLLYSGLGNQGKVKLFSYIDLPDGPSINSTEHYFISKEAARQIKTILANNIALPSALSIKTGTSYGHRDALAIGFDQQYVIGIWIGTPSGAKMGKATGSSVAVPLLQKVHRILPKSPTTNIQDQEQTINFSLNKKSIIAENMHLKQPSENLSLLFPVDQTIIRLEKQDEYPAIPCTISGGTKPYTWLVNGNPLVTQSWQQKTQWQPEKPGFYTLTVIDARGESVTARIEIS